MIAVPIIAYNLKQAVKSIKKASRYADIIELRLDYLKNLTPNILEKLILNKTKPLIVTIRKKEEGGKHKIMESKRIEFFKKAMDLNVDFIDMELSTGTETIKQLIKSKRKTKIIVSYHNFRNTNREEILTKYRKIKSLNPDIIKIVTFANSIDDNKNMFDLIRKANSDNTKIISFCMGKLGEISRILSVPMGAYLTFASLEKGMESAPGQVDVNTLKNIYRVKKLKDPKIFGLVGNPVEHSKGFILHNTRFKKLHLNYIYLNFLVDNLNSFLKNYKSMVSGLSITIPFKSRIIRYLDKIEPTAKKIGAVNTVIKKNNKLIGYNTDMIGAIKAILSKTKIEDKNILIIGAGGVARAIAYGIVKNKGNLIILNRTVSKAKKLAKELNCLWGSLDDLISLREIDVVINATSLGMFPKIEETPINKKILRKITKRGSVIFDSVYNPKKTKLLKDAEKLGLITISGYSMFINQAKEQFRLFLEAD